MSVSWSAASSSATWTVSATVLQGLGVAIDGGCEETDCSLNVPVEGGADATAGPVRIVLQPQVRIHENGDTLEPGAGAEIHVLEIEPKAIIEAVQADVRLTTHQHECAGNPIGMQQHTWSRRRQRAAASHPPPDEFSWRRQWTERVLHPVQGVDDQRGHKV